MLTKRTALIHMHIATFLFGFTAILGKLISLSSFNLVWFRMLIASIVFLFFPKIIQSLKALPKQTRVQFFFIGFIVALHWLTFYGCIKLGGSASLALACFGTIALFAAILEPIFLKTRFKKREIFVGILVIVGLAFIAKSNPDKQFTWSSTYIQAMLIGVVSAFLAALFSVLNKKYVAEYPPIPLTFLQMFGGFVFLTIVLPFYSFYGGEINLTPNWQDIIYLLILAIVCTNIAFSLEMNALKKISAFVSNLILNMEPIYGIVLAILFFNEHQQLNVWFYIGTALVLLSVFIHPYINKRMGDEG